MARDHQLAADNVDQFRPETSIAEELLTNRQTASFLIGESIVSYPSNQASSNSGSPPRTPWEDRSEYAKSIDVISLIMSIRRPLIIGLLIGLVLGILAYMKLGPVYQADTQVLVSQKSQAPGDRQRSAFTPERTEHVHLIMSDAIVRRALVDHGLNELSEFDGAHDPVKDILDSLKATRSAGQDTSFVNLIDLTYIHADKEVAEQVMRSIVAAYDSYLMETRSENSAELLETLAAQEETLNGELSQLQTNYMKFRDGSKYHLATPIVVANGVAAQGKNPYQEKVERIQKDIAAAEARRIEYRSRIETINELKEQPGSRESLSMLVTNWMSTPVSGGGNNAAPIGVGTGVGVPAEVAIQQELNSRLVSAQLNYVRWRQRLGENHDSVLKIKAEINQILQSMNMQGFESPGGAGITNGQPRQRTDMITAYLGVLQHEIRATEVLQRELETQLVTAEEEGKQAALFESEDQKWKDRIAQKQDELKGLRTQVSTLRLSQEQEGYHVKMIADIRVEKSMKRLIKIVGACAILGMVFVFGLAYLREWFDSSLRTTDQLGRWLKLPVLGSFPTFDTTPSTAMGNSGFSPALCYWHRPGSREAEAFRSMRTALFVALDEHNQRVVQVTSPEPGDGKSTTAANLALAAAQSGKRVLLIDGDMRRPTIDRMFGLRREVGLSEILVDPVDWQNTVQRTSIHGLEFITAGSVTGNPAELLSSPMLHSLFRDAADEYDLVVVDSPPVMAVSDPCIIGGGVDGTVLVVRCSKSSQQVILKTRETLEAHGIRIYGTVANDVDSGPGARYNDYSEYYGDGLRSPGRTTTQSKKDPIVKVADMILGR